jgi:hypothetical protein
MTAQPLEPSYLLHPDAADLESATTPLWDETFAATDDETRVYLRALAVAGPVEPVMPVAPPVPQGAGGAAVIAIGFPGVTGRAGGANVNPTPKPKPTPRPAKPAKKAPTADAEARLRKVRKTVAARMAEDFGPGMGGPSA